MTDTKKTTADVKISRAKGRPMLTWVGKQPLSKVTAYPAQLIERFDALPDAEQAASTWSQWPAKYPQGGLLFHGDNKDVLAHLLANGFRGQVKLIYIDPPFDSGADYVRKVQLRGVKGSQKLDGESYTLGEQIQYTDIWANDNYLQFMYERLLMLRELLAEDGSLWLHCDFRRSAYLRILIDEVFGMDGLVNEIVWQRTASRNDANRFGHVHDTLLYAAKSKGQRTWNDQVVPHTDEYLNRYYTLDDGDGRGRYTADNLTAAGLRNGPSGETWRGYSPASQGNHWKYAVSKLDQLDKDGRIYWPKGGSGFPRLKRYENELQGRSVGSIWSDLFVVNSQADERTDYPTQKPESLLERVIESSSNPGDLILDCFIGSGTTAAVAQKLGRRWIGCDINQGAIQTTAKRLAGVMREQAQRAQPPQQQSLVAGEQGSDASEASTAPAQLAFSTWRVNDYDLQIQHNEAVELACEYLGITRQRTDSFFDGSRGSRLVKIIPFNHPLTPLDIEAIRDELKARPDESRDIEVVALGCEVAAQAALEAYNRNKPVNQLHLLELRTDQKYAGFMRHEPLHAAIHCERDGEQLIVEVTDVISPTIIKRLNLEEGLFRAQIDDWRAVVDVILIDTAYDGEVFNVQLSDVPQKKTDLVAGRYELPAPPAGSTVAVKVIDMLGEELIVTRTV